MKEETELTNNIKVTPSLLDAFNLLKTPKDNERIAGAAKIISQLQGQENQKDIDYVLKRLIRSLGATVLDTRTGYFAALVTLLSKFHEITISNVLELVKKELHANGSTKSEVGDVSFGHILACSAIFRSNLILRGNIEEQKEVIHILLSASQKKSYLSTVGYLILLDFISGLNSEQFSSIIWPNVKDGLKKDLKEHSLDSLYFLIVINNKYPEKVKIKKLLGNSDILCEENIPVICEKLMAGIDFNSVNHPIYKEIGILIANSPQLQLFWTGVDNQLVKHNRNRELVAINILTNILSNLKENGEVIPELISRNFFKLLMDWFKGLQTASKIRNKKDDEDDHKIMIKKEKELLNALAKVMKLEFIDSKTRLKVLQKLLFNPGEMNFTEITGTNLVKSLVADLDKSCVKKMAKLLKGVLFNTTKKYVKEDVERIWYNNERVKAAELISYLVSHESVKDDTEFKLTYMKFLMCYGFFKIGDDDVAPVSADLAGAIKGCFYRCFSSRFSSADGLVTVLSSLSTFIDNILQKEQVRTKIEKQFPKENMDCWEMLVGVCKVIEKNESKSKVDKVFLILLYQLGLFLFSEPNHVKIAKSSIKELNSCYEHFKKTKKKKQKLSKEGESLAEDEPEWIEVVVEVLLSILSADSSVLRSVVQCVFRLLWEYLTPSSIGQIVSVLDPESESNPLTQDSGSEDNDEDDDDSNDEEKEKDEDSSTKESDEDIDSQNDDDDDDDEGDLKTPDQLRLAVQKALGGVAMDSDAESLDADMIDEEEGKKLDEALAEAFKRFHHGKGKKNKKERKDKKSLSDFRIRVLDLVDIYLEKDPAMDICLGMIAPLTRCLETCIQDSQFSELENRVRKTIKLLTKVRKFSSVEGTDIDLLCDYLRSIIDKGERSHFMFQALGDVITYFTIFIIHCSQKIESEKNKGNKKSPKKAKSGSPLVTVLKEALQNYFQNRSCLLPVIFFHNVLQTEWEGNYELVPIIVENVFNNNVRQFRRNEGLELLAGFYRSLKRSKPTSEKVLQKLEDLEATFQTSLLNALEAIEVKKNFFVVLRKLINTIKMFHESCHLKSNIDFKTLLDKLSTCKATVKSKGPAVQNNKNMEGKSKKKKKKRKIEQANGHIEPAKKKSKN